MKTTKILISICVVLFLTTIKMTAQVTIGSQNAPNTNAVLDLQSTNKGLLLPNVALTSTTSAAPLTAHVKGMVVYNTATAGDVTPGQYSNDGTKWVRANSSTLSTVSGTAPIAVANGGTAPVISLNDAGVTTAKLADNSVTSVKIVDGAVATTDLANSAVTTAKLADNSVTTAKIVDGTIATADLANNAVTVAKLPAGATSSTFLRGDGTWQSVGDKIGIWNLGATDFSFVAGSQQLTGTSTLGTNEIGLVAGTNSVTVPAGRYLVSMSGDIAVAEYGYVNVRSGGSVVIGIYYGEQLSGSSYVLSFGTATTLTMFYTSSPGPGGTTAAGYKQAPYTSTYSYRLTFLKLN